MNSEDYVKIFDTYKVIKELQEENKRLKDKLQNIEKLVKEIKEVIQ